MKESGIFKRSPSELLDFTSIFIVKSPKKQPQIFKSLTQKKIAQPTRPSMGVKHLLKQVITDKFTKKHLNDTCIFKPTKSLKEKMERIAVQNVQVHKTITINGQSQCEGGLKRTKSNPQSNIAYRQSQKSQKIIGLNHNFQKSKLRQTDWFVKNQHSLSYKDRKSHMKQSLSEPKSAFILSRTAFLTIDRELKSQMRTRANCIINEVNLQISKSRQSLKSNLLNPQEITQSLRLQQRKELNKRFMNRIKRFKYKDFHHNSQQVEAKDQKNPLYFLKDIPDQLQINKIVFPKRENRQEFLSNLKRLNNFTVNINECSSKNQRQISKWMRKQGKNVTYKIKIQNKNNKNNNQQRVHQDPNNSFINRVDWEKFSNQPFLPWQNEHSDRQKFKK